MLIKILHHFNNLCHKYPGDICDIFFDLIGHILYCIDMFL